MRITILATLIVLLLAEVGLSHVEERVPPALEWDDQFTQDKADQIAKLDGLDVVILGSSVANAELDATTIAGDAVGYNAALPSRTPRVWAEWFDDVLANLRPKVVVIAVDIRQYSDNKPGGDGQLWRYLGSVGRIAHVTGAEDSLASRTRDSFAITRLKSRIREPDKFFAAVTGFGDIGDWRDTKLDEAGRYTNFDSASYVHRPEVLEELAEGAFLDFSVGGVEQDAVHRIVSSAEDIGARVVLVATPSMRTSLTTALPNGTLDFAAYDASIQAIASERSIPLIRYPDLDDRKELFADLYHMNGTGSELISARLRDDIVELLNRP